MTPLLRCHIVRLVVVVVVVGEVVVVDRLRDWQVTD